MNCKRYLSLFVTIIVAGVFLVVGFTGSASAQKTYKFRLQHWHPTSSATYKLFISDKGFPAMVKRASGGRIIIETYPVNAVVPVTDQFRSVSRGVIDMAAGVPAYQAGLGAHWVLLYGIPFTMGSMEDVEVVWRERGLFQYASQLYAKQNVKLIGFHHDAPISIFSKKPIRKVEDFRGMKIRAVGAYGDFYTQLGASALTTPGSEIYLALDRGLADACTWGSESAMMELGLGEVTKYIILPWMSGGTMGDMYMNMGKWNDLPDDLKQIMTSCMQDWGVALGASYRSDTLKARALAQKKHGMEIIWLSPSETEKLKKEAQKLLDRYEKRDPESAKIVKIYKDYLAEKGH